MKRTDLIRHLESHGCELAREGSRHSIYRKGDKISGVPRHREINNITAKNICKDLEVPEPPRK